MSFNYKSELFRDSYEFGEDKGTYEDNDMCIVMVTEGKREVIDNAWVSLFNSPEEAKEYIRKTNNTGEKYWTKAQLVEEGIEIDGDHLIGWYEEE